MATVACLLMCHGPECLEHYGVALIDSVTGVPLPISRNAFGDVADADEFVAWVRESTGAEVRRYSALELYDLVEEFGQRAKAVSP